jgi:type II secretory pathway component GspD/PulD (secretin)
MMKKFLVGLLILSQTAACAFPRPSIKADVASASKPKLPEKDQMLSKEDDPAILDIPISDTVFVPQSLEKSESLPSAKIEGFNAYEMRSSDALRLLLQDKKIPVIFDVGTNDRIVNAVNLSGSLESVLEKISHIGGVFYSFENGVLKVKGSRRFSVSLPPIQSSFGDISSVIKGMGATDVNLDNFSRSINFSASREVYDDVRTYLQKVRETRSMLVYESYFFEVTLNDDSALGINFADATNSQFPNWLNLKFNSANQAGTVGNTAAYSLGSTYTSSKFNINLLTNFLQTQGSVETLSKPTISVISGTSSSFRVGNTLRYISQTQTTASTTTGTTGTPANPTITVTTDKLDLGLKLDLTGDFEEDTIFTAIKIDLTNLTSLDTFSSGDASNATTLKLPQTNERSLETSVRVRPGDTILIGGIQQSKDSTNSTGTPEIGGLSAQTYRAGSTTRSELVIVMRPKVIRFVPRSKMLQAGTMSSSYKSSESAAYGAVGGASNQPGASVALVEPLSALPANKTPSLSTAAAPAEPLVPRNDLPQDALPKNLQAAPPIRNSLDGMVGLMNRAGN